MKRTLVCAAALTLLSTGQAQAQSPSVSIYGAFDTGAYSKQLSGTQRVARVDGGMLTTSHLGFRGDMEINADVKANFDLAAFFQSDRGEPTRGIPGEAFFSRAAWVGLASKRFGQVRLGRISTPNFINMIRSNPFGASATVSPTFLHQFIAGVVQPMATINGPTDSGWDNSVAYNSPTIAGFTAAFQAAPGEGNTDFRGGRRHSGSLTYGGYPFTAIVSYESVSRVNIVQPLSITTLAGSLPPFTFQEFDTIQVGLTHDFRFIKLYGSYNNGQVKGLRTGLARKLEVDTYQLGLSAPALGGQVLLSGAYSEKQFTATNDQTRTTVTGAYVYPLSKRTDVYGIVMTDKVTTENAADLSRGTGYSVGLRHQF